MRAFAIAAAVFALASSEAHAAGIEVGKPAPDTVIRPISGPAIKLSSLRGQVVLLNYWATWCVPCRTELPTLDRYYRATNKYGFRVFAVTTEDSVPLYKMKPLFAAMAITPARRIGGTYSSFESVPTNVVIDRNGVVRYASAGALDLDDLNRILIPLFKEAASESAGQH